MTIIQAIMLALMPSMALFALLLCKPEFRRKSEKKPEAPIRAQSARRGVYRPYLGFAGIASVGRSPTVKGDGNQTPAHRR